VVPVRLVTDPEAPVGELGELAVPRGSGRCHACLRPGLTAGLRAADRGAAAQVGVGRVGGEELPAGGKNRTVRARVDEIGGGDGRRERLPEIGRASCRGRVSATEGTRTSEEKDGDERR